MTQFAIGDLSPDFSIEIAEGKTISLNHYRGKYLVLYFYPKDNTPGCIIEARNFNSLRNEFKELGAEIIGISKDSLSSHDRFCRAHNLQIDLGSDPEQNICREFNVLKQKSMFGKKYMSVERSTFLIDKSGRFAYIWPSVSVLGHAREVLHKLKEIIQGGS